MRQFVDDYIPVAPAAASAEPMRKADHKAKRHSRPVSNKTKRPSRHSGCGGRITSRRIEAELVAAIEREFGL